MYALTHELVAVSGTVLDLKKCAVHDGPGIRTTVFLKGCPLRCLWCHNPESIEFRPQLKCISLKCRHCGTCVGACAHGSHRLADGRHVFGPADCVACGRCVADCPAGALEIVGVRRTVDDIMRQVLKDRAYFARSGGGLTVSGGEPMCQPDFTRALLRAARDAGIHTCLDTCGQVPFDRYVDVVDSVDIFLYDIKETDPARHKEFTGVDNRLILENLHRLDELGAATILRCPIVPGLNDREEHLASIGAIAGSLRHVIEVNILPFHPYGAYKSDQIGRQYALRDMPAAPKELAERWVDMTRKCTPVPVR